MKNLYHKHIHSTNDVIFILQIRSNIHALHVDVKEGQTEAIIRFDTPKSAEEVKMSTNLIVSEGAGLPNLLKRAASHM